MPNGSQRIPFVVAAISLAFLGACSTSPNKRELQYLNTDGFGNRYTGNAEEQNYVTLHDSISIADAYHQELNGSYTVDIDGTVVLPEVGAVYIAGLTRSELEAFLMQKYSPYYEQLDIKVKLQAGNKIYFIFGEVQTQGAEPFQGDLTVFEAVAKALPDRQTANLGRVRVIHADPRDPRVIYCNLSDLVESGDSTFNIHIEERDIIYVPPTMLAQLGYFLSDLLFPVTEVFRSVGGIFFGRGVRNGGGFGGGLGGGLGGAGGLF